MFVMRLSASGKGFHRVYFNQAQEVFLDGHVEAFDHFGGVPKRIRYDNLKPAVVRVMKGRGRIETERFIAMRSHYGFESFFCQPGVKGAHEKGGVEGEVGRFRRRNMVPVPDVVTLVALNELVAEGDERDDHRHIESRRLTVGQHFAAERPLLKALPDEPFEVALQLSCRVDTKARICVRQSFYSVPVRYAGRRIDVRLGADARGGHGRGEHRRPPPPGRRQRSRGARPRPLPGGPLHQARSPGRGQCPGGHARRTGAFTDTHQRFWDLAEEEARRPGRDPGPYRRCCCSTAP